LAANRLPATPRRKTQYPAPLAPDFGWFRPDGRD